MSGGWLNRNRKPAEAVIFQGESPMSKLGILFGGWIAMNVVLAVALLSRRPIPHLSERLFRWVIGNARSSRPHELTHGNGRRPDRR
jgi:hypothetical protein